MFLMMVSEAADTELTAELLRTVRTLVVDDGNAGSTGTSAAHHVFPEDSASSSGRSLWADVQFFMTGEAVKAFPGFFESASTTTSAFGVADKVIPDAASSSNSARYTVTANTLQGDPVAEDTLDFIPSDESVRRVLSHLEGHSSAAMPDSSASPSAIAVNELDDALYQLVRDQGALQSLVDTLHCKATTLEPAGRLDVLHTICKLIHRNRACQRDFKEIGGYAALSSLFDHLDDKALASFEVRTRFFTDAFNLFAAVCVDGNEHGFVDNVDALDTVVRIAANASNLDARKAALST